MEQQEATQGQRETSAASMATELKEQVTEQARGLAEQAQEAAESQKGRLADGATQVAQALHHASEGLRTDEQQTVSDYTEALAGQLEKVAQFLQSRDLPTMAREVGGFARRQPALFLGGAFTLGIVAARFLKSSSGEGGQSLSERTTVPLGTYDASDEDLSGSDGDEGEDEQGEYDGRPDPALHPPGGVPPLPSANGGGL